MHRQSRIGVSALVLALLAGSVPLSAQSRPPSPDEAPIALLVDSWSGQTLLKREVDRRFLPASVTKVMTAYLAFEMLENGEIREDQRIMVSAATAKEWAGKGSTMFLEAGEVLTIRDLLMGITTVSANDGCIALARGTLGSEGKWVERMNAEARKLGMRDSHFGTPNGFPDEGRTFTSARDLAILASAMLEKYPRLYRTYFGHRYLVRKGIWQDNHDPITGVVKGADGIKTGFTREAGYNFLGTAQRDGRRLVMVVAGIDSGGLRKQVARDLMEWGFADFDARQLFARGHVVARARVQDGTSQTVDLLAPKPIYALLPKGVDKNLQLHVIYDGPLKTPFRKGDRVAELEVSGEGITPFRVPLEAASGMDRAGPLQRLLNGLYGLFL